MDEQILVIAVDGPAASGKGTLSRQIADHYSLHYLDTGSLYRAVALLALDSNTAFDDIGALCQIANTLTVEITASSRLRVPGVGEAASKIAGIEEVRAALLDYQRRFAKQAPGAVLDGRDIGTIVCPDADVKLFVTASVEERAKRRFRELVDENPTLTLQEIQGEIIARDERDTVRASSPLLQAEDAHLLDTTNLDIEAAMRAAVQLIDQAIAAKN